MEGKVKIRNTADCEVTVSLPDLRFRRSWPKKNSVIPVDFAILEEGIFDPGFANLINSGVLYIEDMDTKIALGLEPEGAQEPQNIIILNDSQILRLVKVDSYADFEKEPEDISEERVNNICDYVMANERMGMDPQKAELLKKRTGIDVIKSIQLNRQNAE